jgi:hypothetical protein
MQPGSATSCLALRLAVLSQQRGRVVVEEHQPVTGPALGGRFLVQLSAELEDRPRHGEHRTQALLAGLLVTAGHLQLRASPAGREQ